MGTFARISCGKCECPGAVPSSGSASGHGKEGHIFLFCFSRSWRNRCLCLCQAPSDTIQGPEKGVICPKRPQKAPLDGRCWKCKCVKKFRKPAIFDQFSELFCLSLTKKMPLAIPQYCAFQAEFRPVSENIFFTPRKQADFWHNLLIFGQFQSTRYGLI